MKMNWGTGIILSFVIFVGAIALIIIFPFNQKVDLVTNDYYERELRYQEQIDKTSRTAMLEEEIKINRNKNTVEIIYPGSYGKISGEIIFYRPSDSSKDIEFNIAADSAGKQVIDIGSLVPGLWKLKISWNMNGQGYYIEKIIMN